MGRRRPMAAGVRKAAGCSTWGQLVAAALLLFVMACEEREPVSPQGVDGELGAVTEWRPLATTEPASRKLGEDCTRHGHAECISGLCLHASSRRNAGYVCSQACRIEAECPSGWRCVTLLPGGSEAMCMPPVEARPE